MSNEHDELQQRLEQVPKQTRSDKATADTPEAAVPSKDAKVNFTQWEIWPNDGFRATGGTRPTLPAGVYRVHSTDAGLIFRRAFIVTDKLIDLKDTSSSEIIEGIKTFWRSEEKFNKLGILYKRGVLLWGPPGSGKTVTVSMLIQELVASGGMVLLCEHPRMTVEALAQMRRIEPDRRLIVVEEDIEEIMREHGEHALLALLDGENQIANVVHVATTNYPEELGARIINRPSRFDEVKKIGMPNAAAREAYLEATVPKPFPSTELARWVEDTEDMSIAHLRELVVAVFCLGRSYEETLIRLQKMQLRPRSHEDGFKRGQVGMGVEGLASAKAANASRAI